MAYYRISIITLGRENKNNTSRMAMTDKNERSRRLALAPQICTS
jgi:hypothetical protein